MEEQVTIVDAANRVVGSAPRSRMRREGLPHRATYVFVFDSEGRLYVQHRTVTKDVYPGYWDLAAGGVVLAGESYEESAVRELAEEMGISGVPLEPWFDFYFEDGASKVWGRVWSCVYEGPLVLQQEEVQGVERMPVEDILDGSVSRQFTPDSLIALRKRFR